MSTEPQATDWSPEVEEIRHRRALAMDMGGEEGIARQHRNGKYTVRERIEKLFDAGTFREFGALTGDAEYLDGRLATFTPANGVIGVGRIGGRQVAVSADDFTIRGGASDGGGPIKDEWVHHVAHEWKIPFVRLIDGGSGSIRGAIDEGRTHIPYDGS